jgi:hypothetical protein
MKKLLFADDDVIAGRHIADLGEYGTFSADHILVTPELPVVVRAVGTLETMPAHLEEPVVIPATLDLDLGPFWDDPENEDLCAQPTYPPADVVETLTAADFFQAPWRGWGCEDIPEEWKY